MASTDDKKAEFYKLVKIGGLIIFIPMILAIGPLTGYFIGNFLEKKLGFAPYISLACIALGFVASAREIIRIINIMIKEERKP